MAWIKPKEGVTLSEAEVQAFCHGRIMDYKIPHYIKFVTEFPATVTGKVQKFRMREMSVAELGLTSLQQPASGEAPLRPATVRS
jgi:fatty-acyl-CoA synthase